MTNSELNFRYAIYNVIILLGFSISAMNALCVSSFAKSSKRVNSIPLSRTVLRNDKISASSTRMDDLSRKVELAE